MSFLAGLNPSKLPLLLPKALLPKALIPNSAVLAGFILLSGCTLSHSKQALFAHTTAPPSPSATFVTEEDSGLSVFGLVTVTEPDHYAVLLERARRRYHCDRLVYPQLDFYTDHWLVVAFPIARVTLLCEHSKQQAHQPIVPQLVIPAKQIATP